MAFGFGVLRLSPTAFWAMTLREVAAVARGISPAREAMRRDALEAMMRRFPDR